jgi:(p)ppGpp synthase/HD superfamily hydrolase
MSVPAPTEPNLARPFALTPTLERALRRCAEWHAGQTRKGSATPYVQHVVGVALILDRLGFDEEVVIAGLLHDAVEDVEGLTLDRITAEFGPRVAELVGWCSETKTDDAGRTRPWIDRKTDHIAHLRQAPPEARAVALADKLHNLTSILVDLQDGRPVWSIFNAGREQVLWYHDACIAAYRGGDPRLEALAASCREIRDAVAAFGSE